MIRITNERLTIELEAAEPLKKRDMLLRAIAATMRWMASETDTTHADQENQYVLAQLMEALAELDGDEYLRLL